MKQQVEIVGDYIKSQPKRHFKLLLSLDLEILTYKTLEILETTLGHTPELDEEGKPKKMWSKTSLADVCTTLGQNLVMHLVDQSKEKVNVQYFHAGYKALYSFVDAGYIEFAKTDPDNKRSEYKIHVKRGKEFEFAELVSVIDVEVPEGYNSKTRPQYDRPIPWEGFYHNVAGKMITNINPEAVSEFTTEKCPKVFDVINKHQDVAYKINTDLLTIYEGCWEDPIFTFEGKDLDEEALIGKSRERDKIIEVAKSVEDRTFWEYLFYDFRGRLYSSSVWLSHAGAKLSKSLYLYADAKPLTSEGYYWLFVHAANCYGFDKLSIDGRYDEADKNMNEWLTWAKDPVNNKEWQEADSPFEFLAAIREIAKAHAHEGGPFEYPSGLPVAWDASCSGLQVLSALSADEISGKLCNLTATDERGDYYKMIAEHVWKGFAYTPEEEADANEIASNLKKLDKLKDVYYRARNWDMLTKINEKRKAYLGTVGDKFQSSAKVFWAKLIEKHPSMGRKVCKRPCMTYFYSAQAKTMANQLYNDFKAEPEFKGLSWSFAKFLTDRIYAACQELMPQPTELMKLFQETGRAFAAEGEQLEMYAPYTNFFFMQTCYKPEVSRVPVIYKKKHIRVNVMINKQGKVDKEKVKSATSPNVVHMLDSQIVAGVIDMANYTVSTIHDSFSAPAADAGKLFEDTRTVFIEMFKNDILGELIENHDVQYGDLDLDEAYQNEHCFS